MTGQPCLFEAVLPNGQKGIIIGGRGPGPSGLPWYMGDPSLGADGYFATPEAAMDAIDRKYGLVDLEPSAAQLRAATVLITTAGEMGVMSPSASLDALAQSPSEMVGIARTVLALIAAHVADWRTWAAFPRASVNVARARKAVRLMSEQRDAVEILLSSGRFRAGEAAEIRWVANSRAEIKVLLDNLPQAAPAPPPAAAQPPSTDAGDAE